MRYTRALVFLFALATLACSAGRKAGVENLGTIDFPNSGAAEAQEPFIRGVLLLHSFEFEDAREAFVEAQEIDPDFALAYWGEAMTHNHPLWRQVEPELALEALARYAPDPEARAARAPTARERGYLAAVDALYGPGGKHERDLAYNAAMRQLSEAYPDDLEAKSFYALSILGTLNGERETSVYMHAGSVAEEVYAVHPEHPGALHYLIHSYDDPEHATLGLRAARVYADVAPAASHAQHMISHIYMALGRWEESIDANVKSIQVAVDRRERKDLEVDALNYHSMHWLAYSYLQLERFEDARAVLDAMARYAEESGSERALWHHASMRASWIVETDGLPIPPSLAGDMEQLSGWAADRFATGYAAIRAGDLASAEAALAEIERRLESGAESAAVAHCAVGDVVTEGDQTTTRVMTDSLKALIAIERGRTEDALALMDRATAAEAGLPTGFGPPEIVKPSHELYGEILLELGRLDAAREQFEAALKLAPRRRLSVAGLRAVDARASMVPPETGAAPPPAT